VIAAISCGVQPASASRTDAQRVFVAATGSDGNPCSFASPCRSFQHAHDVAPAGGEIDVLDPAGYGPLTITKAISIQGHGFSGISVPSGGTGITINAPSTATVHLNGLLIEGGGVGQSGIVFNSGKSLTIANCIVRNVTNDGLDFFPNGTTPTTLAVSNSYFADSSSSFGIAIQPQGSGATAASIERTGLYGNSTGLYVIGAFSTGALSVAVTDSVAAHNHAIGFFVQSSAGHSIVNLSLTHTLAEGNATGIETFGQNATIWLAQSTLSGNTVQSFVGDINTFGDNYFIANADSSGTLTAVGKQ
jgi:hypothetical protein